MLSGLPPLVTASKVKIKNNKLDKNKKSAALKLVNVSRCVLLIAKKYKNQFAAVKTPTTVIQIQSSPLKSYKTGRCPLKIQIRKQVITIKKDLTVAFVKALARFAPRRLKIVLPAEASRARKENRMYLVWNYKQHKNAINVA